MDCEIRCFTGSGMVDLLLADLIVLKIKIKCVWRCCLVCEEREVFEVEKFLGLARRAPRLLAPSASSEIDMRTIDDTSHPNLRRTTDSRQTRWATQR